MLFAASVGDVKAFRHGFHKLLRPEFEEIYQKQRDKLTEEFGKIFVLGDNRSSGARIAVALLKAQELGLEIPSSVYNFSQGQIRLQNAIDNMNQEIENLEKYADMFTRSHNMENDYFDLTDKRRENAHTRGDKSGNGLEVGRKAFVQDMFEYAANPQDFRYVFENYGNTFEEYHIGRMKTSIKKMPEMIRAFKDKAKQAQSMKAAERNSGGWINQIFDQKMAVAQIVPKPMFDEMNRLLTKGDVSDEKINAFAERLQKAADDATKAVKAFDELTALEKKIIKKHGGKYLPDAEESAAVDAAIGKFMESYHPIQQEKVYDNKPYETAMDRMTKEDNAGLREDMDRFFGKHPAHKDEFMEKFKAVQDAVKNKLKDTDPTAYKALLNDMSDTYLKIMFEQIREKEKLFTDASEESDDDFLSVMGDVIEKESSSAVGRIGIFKSLSYKRKLNKAKEAKEKMDEAAKTKDD